MVFARWFVRTPSVLAPHPIPNLLLPFHFFCYSSTTTTSFGHIADCRSSFSNHQSLHRHITSNSLLPFSFTLLFERWLGTSYQYSDLLWWFVSVVSFSLKNLLRSLQIQNPISSIPNLFFNSLDWFDIHLRQNVSLHPFPFRKQQASRFSSSPSSSFREPEFLSEATSALNLNDRRNFKDKEK